MFSAIEQNPVAINLGDADNLLVGLLELKLQLLDMDRRDPMMHECRNQRRMDDHHWTAVSKYSLSELANSSPDLAIV